MKKHLFNIILAALILGTILGITSPVKSQGLVELAVLNVTGTLGNNGFYVSDVAYSWTLPDTAIPESIVGCESGTITQDTPPEGVFLLCFGDYLGGTFIGGIIDDNGNIQDPIIKRDATGPTLALVSPSQPQVSVDEGSSLTLQAVAQDVNAVTVGWDLDEDGTVDAPNPTTVQIPGNITGGGPSPCFIVTAVDEAGNVSQIVVEATIINLAPSIDSLVAPPDIHFGGTVLVEATASDPGDDPLSATVHWGDGLIEPVVVKPDGSLTAEHVYPTPGSFEIKLQVADDEGAITEERRTVVVEDPIQSIGGSLIPGTLALVPQGILNAGQADSLVVKLEGAVAALANDRPAAPQKLDAYLNEYAAVVPNGQVTPCFLMATDIRDGLVLYGWVPEPD